MKDGSLQLKHTYAQMLDGELQGLAREMDNLSEVAKPLLLDELSRRGLEYPPEAMDTGPDAPKPDEPELVPVTQARTVDDLSDLRDVLDAARIPSFLGPSRTPGWIGVSVRKEDEELAVLAIEHAAQRKQEGFDEFTDHPEICPECGSPEIAVWANELSEDSEPEAEPEFHWVCESCKHEWVNDGLEAQ